MANDSSGPRRVLVITKSFREGFGGTPESVLLLARCLWLVGTVCDVISDEGLFTNVHGSDKLGPVAAPGLRNHRVRLAHYAGLLVAGPWLGRAVSFVIGAYLRGIPITYAPKGGLGRGDFSRLRDLKKIPYLLTVELFLLMLAKKILFSSTVEQRKCVLPEFLIRGKHAILPEPFLPAPLRQTWQGETNGTVTLGFLGLIRPLKGLRELVQALVLLSQDADVPAFRLRVAGAARPGAEAYLAQVRKLADRHLPGRVEWLGIVLGEQEKSDFYESLDIFTCPSQSESFGFTPLEALWHGVPAAIGPDIGVRDYLPKDAPISVFENVGDKAICRTLKDLIGRREMLTQAGREWRGRTLPALVGEDLARRFTALLTAKDHTG